MPEVLGTDGVCGHATCAPITAETGPRLSTAIANVARCGEQRRTAAIGKETRLSGDLLEPALTAGFAAMGMDVVLLGAIPAPAVGMVTRSLRADVGIMISGFHNPTRITASNFSARTASNFPNTGKPRSNARWRRGPKLCHRLHWRRPAAPAVCGRHEALHRVRKGDFAGGLRLDGLRVAVDCANGAAYTAAPRVFYELGAEVVSATATRCWR